MAVVQIHVLGWKGINSGTVLIRTSLKKQMSWSLVREYERRVYSIVRYALPSNIQFSPSHSLVYSLYPTIISNPNLFNSYQEIDSE